MLIPSNDECRQILDELQDEPNLSQWESDFVADNEDREFFTDSQKAVIARMQDKYDV